MIVECLFISIPEMEKNKCTRLRFTYEDDLAFLREFINQNPLRDVQGWEVIRSHLNIICGKEFTIKTLKQHLHLLIEIWLKKVKTDEIRSGIEEALTEKDVLLQEVSNICEEYNYNFQQRKRPASKEQQICELGRKARDSVCKKAFIEEDKENRSTEENLIAMDTSQFAHSFHDYIVEDKIPVEIHEEIDNEVNTNTSVGILQINETTTPSTSGTSKPKSIINKESEKVVPAPIRKRVVRKESLRKNSLSYLMEKNEQERRIRFKELDLEEKKIAIEKEKIEIEKRRVEIEEKRTELELKKIEYAHTETMEKLKLDQSKHETELEEKKITNQLLQYVKTLIEKMQK